MSSKNDKKDETPVLSKEDEVRETAKRNLERIDLESAKSAGAKISVKTTRKLLRLMHEHGEGSIKSVQVMPNFDDGAAPHRLPSGFRMIFDASKSPVIAETYPLESMYAGTMALRIPASELASSPLTSEGPNVTTGELVKMISQAQGLSACNEVLADGYTGLFSHEMISNDEDYERDYWLVTRSVNPQLNEQLAEAITAKDRDEKTTLGQLMNETEQLRYKTYSEQRRHRAEQVSAALAAFHINISAERILSNTRQPVIDNVFNTIEADESGGDDVALFCNAVPLHDSNLSTGVLLTNTLRLGPTLLQGTPLGRGEAVNVASIAAFPSTMPTVVSPWKIKQNGGTVSSSSITIDGKCKLSTTNSPFTWTASGASATHAMLAKNLYTKSSDAGWRQFQSAAGFQADRATTLRPLAVALD